VIQALALLAGAWTGQLTCKTGNYGAAANLIDGGTTMVVRYNSVSGGPTPMRANGRVDVRPRGKPGEFTAVSSQGVAVKVSLAEKGQVLLFEPDPAATGLAALIKFSGTARLDKKRTKATLRFTVASPLGPDSCMGAMAKSVQTARKN
jgi:hypothetical protein